jgi:hypothetical protein
MYWSVPSYAPSGIYTAIFQVNGYLNEEDDVEEGDDEIKQETQLDDNIENGFLQETT